MISNAGQQHISHVSKVELYPFEHEAVWLACVAADWGEAAVFSDKKILKCRLCARPVLMIQSVGHVLSLWYYWCFMK